MSGVIVRDLGSMYKTRGSNLIITDIPKIPITSYILPNSFRRFQLCI